MKKNVLALTLLLILNACVSSKNSTTSQVIKFSKPGFEKALEVAKEQERIKKEKLNVKEIITDFSAFYTGLVMGSEHKRR